MFFFLNFFIRIDQFFVFIILEKTSELVESVKQTAHDAGVKAQELEKSAEASLLQAEKAGKHFIFKLISFVLIIIIIEFN